MLSVSAVGFHFALGSMAIRTVFSSTPALSAILARDPFSIDANQAQRSLSCSATFPVGTTANLSFSNGYATWGGDCPAVTAHTCTLTLDADRTVTAAL